MSAELGTFFLMIYQCVPSSLVFHCTHYAPCSMAPFSEEEDLELSEEYTSSEEPEVRPMAHNQAGRAPGPTSQPFS